MAGFMAGFGQAFSASYNKAKDRRHDKEQDEMRMRFQEAMADKEYKKQIEKEDRDALREAQKFVRDQQAQAERDSRLNQYDVDRYNIQRENAVSDREELRTYNRGLLEEGRKYDEGQKEKDREYDTKKAEQASKLKREEKEAEYGLEQQKAERAAQQEAEAYGDLYGLDAGQVANVYSIIRKGGDPKQLLKEGARPPKTQEQTQQQAPASQQMNRMLNPEPISSQSMESQQPGTAPSEPLQINPGWTLPKDKENEEKISDLADPEKLDAQIVLAQEKGDSKRVELLTDIKSRIMSTQAAKTTAIAQANAEAKGERFVPTQAVVGDKYVNISEDPNNPGQFVNAVTGEPLPKEARVVNANEIASRTRVFEKLAPAMTDYEDKVSSFQKLRSNYEELNSLFKQYPNALSAGGNLASWAAQLGRDAHGVLNLLEQGNVEEIISQGYESNLEYANAQIDKLLSQGVRDEAMGNALVKAKMLQIAFDKAKLMHGSKMSNQDFENTYKTITGNSSDPTTIMRLGQNELAQEKKGLDSQYQRLVNDPLVRNHMETYQGVNPIETLKPVGLESEESISQGNQIQPNTQGLKPIGKTPDGKIVYEDEQGNRGTLD
jgi:hypothetical protein